MLRSRLVILFCAVLLGSACTTPASRTAIAPEVGGDSSTSGEDAATPAVAAAEADDPMVCERIAQTGTRVSQRVCMRRSQVEAKQRAAQDLLGEVQKRGVQANQAKE